MSVLRYVVQGYESLLGYIHSHLLLTVAVCLALVATFLILKRRIIAAWVQDWFLSNEIKGRVGTLSYTGRSLFMVFVWLLLGDFCVQIMWHVFPKITPVTMESMGSKNLLISLVCVSIPSIVNATICPWVSFKSDRHRSKWGRRRPFMLLPTLMTTVFLVLMGLSPDIGRQLHHLFVRFHFSQVQVALALIAVFSVGFQYFNMFIDSVYWYLFADVVPAVFLGTFNGFFRVVSYIAVAVFNFKILPLVWSTSHHVEHVNLDNVRWIFIGCGLLYLVGFTLMTLMVKEGEYPPPPENVGGQLGPFASIKTYFVECFTHRFYWIFFGTTTFIELVGCIAIYETLLQKQALGIGAQQVGNIWGVGMIVGACVSIPIGMLADKYHPLRVLLFGMIALGAIVPLRLIYLFYNFPPEVAFKVEFALQMLLIPMAGIYLVTRGPLYAKLLPIPRLGQFSSAAALVRSIANLSCGLLAGAFMDLMKSLCKRHHMPETYYFKFVPIWTWMCYIIALVFTVMLYRYWKKLGGDKSYQPPEVGCDSPADQVLVTEN